MPAVRCWYVSTVVVSVKVADHPSREFPLAYERGYEMRLLTTGAACAATTVGLAAALVSPAHAAGSGPPLGGPPLKVFLAPAAMKSRSVSPLLAKELAALTNQGLSPARAWQAIVVQGRLAEAGMQGRLEADLGSSFGGVWFEAATAQLHVGVTSTTSRMRAQETVAHAGVTGDVTITVVRSTRDQLLAAQNAWNDKLARLLVLGQVQTGIEPEHNAMIVTLSSSVPASERAAIEREASSADVNVVIEVMPQHALIVTPQAATKCNLFVTYEAFCSKPITSGVTIKGAVVSCTEVANRVSVRAYKTKAECEERKKPGKEGTWLQTAPYCTAGPLAVTANKRKRYVLTAGHCLEGETEHWYGINVGREEGLIGPAREFSFGALERGASECGGKCEGGDYGEIEIERPGLWSRPLANNPVFAVTAEWEKVAETSYPVKGRRAPAVGNTTCHQGQTTGGSCGPITRENVTFAYINENEGCVENEKSKEGEQFFETEKECREDEKIGKKGKWERRSTVVNGMVIVEGPSPQLITLGGDSGGPFMLIEANNEAVIEGILSGGGGFICKENAAAAEGKQFFGKQEECEEQAKFPVGAEGKWERRQEAFFYPVEKALAKLNLELLTTANEVVPPVFEPATKQKVTGTSGTSKLVAATNSVTCSSDVLTGEVASSTLIGGVVIHFLGCKSSGSEGSNCTVKSTGSPGEGLILTSTLHGILGSVLPKPESGSEVGLLLLPVSGKTITTLGSNKCTLESAVTGDVAGLVEPTGGLQTTGKIVFGVTSGKQSIRDIDLSTGLVAPDLVAFSTTATEEGQESLTYEKAIEVV
jgi:hypothetical protein